MISEPMVHSAQTVHLSCVKISIYPNKSKRASTWAYSTWSTVWYVWRKPCTYLASTLAPSRNGPKRGSTSTASPRSSIGFVQNDFHAYGMFWRKPCTYLALTQTPTPNGPKWDMTWPTSPLSSIGCVQNDFRAYGTFSVNNAPILRQD
jgi:hypothetical protein